MTDKLREDCKDNFQRQARELRDLTKLPDGAIPCIQKKMGNKLSYGVFIPILALLVSLLVGSYAYTTTGQKEHGTLATKQEVREIKEDIEKKIDEVKEELKEVEVELKQEMKEMKKEILDAIKNLK